MLKKPKLKLTPEKIAQNKIAKKEIDALKSTILDSLSSQERVGLKDYSWKTEGFSISNLENHFEMRTLNKSNAYTSRIFKDAGYSIEVFARDVAPNIAKDGLTAKQLYIYLSDSVTRDGSYGEIIHDENTNGVCICLDENDVKAIVPNDEQKNKPLKELIGSSHYYSIYSSKPSYLSSNKPPEEITEHYCEDKINKKLESINPKFSELWNTLMDRSADKEFIENEENAYKKLQEAMSKKVTTEGVKKTGGFFSRLFGKDKEKDSQDRS